MKNYNYSIWLEYMLWSSFFATLAAIDVNIEGFQAIKNAGHEILLAAYKEFEGDVYRKACLNKKWHSFFRNATFVINIFIID